jgi:hypothetical protein
MLTLPKDWHLFPGGTLAVELYTQVPQFARRSFVWHLISASLELAIAGIFRRERPPPLVAQESDFSWRIRDFTYVYLPDTDNAAFAKAIDLGSRSVHVTLIVPPGHEEILSRACRPILKGRTPPILSLETVISFRVLFSSGHFGWTHERVVLELLRRYNRRVLEAACDQTLLIDIPPFPEQSGVQE